MTLTFTELTGFGLRLTAWPESAVPQLVAGMNDPEFLRWDGMNGSSTDEAAALRIIRSRAEGWRSGGFAQFCITDRATGEILGNVGLHQIEHQRRVAGIGYWLLAGARGRGVATRAVELCTRWGFEEVGLHRLELGHAVGNEPSCKVARRAGYAVEGVARGALPAPESGVGAGTGGRVDMHAHARLATDPYPDTA
ncbi:acetyltransferase [Streptomyces spiroverticillatus]|uniref:Acetyltransferase n=1 Tax=Streptomyces finlayi TaxID=67296 RepID=A0A919C6V8_9ACTN|nr:GNAT family N-acetyltransferase [Streptomyces finlayi]GGZ86057.1 acetyltransferase [Streptomyces spiroverticillatus]GHC77571.1 acetyltransferase [Streptomyces finlayi]